MLSCAVNQHNLYTCLGRNFKLLDWLTLHEIIEQVDYDSEGIKRTNDVDRSAAIQRLIDVKTPPECPICLSSLGHYAVEIINFFPCRHEMHMKCYENYKSKVFDNIVKCPLCCRQITHTYQTREVPIVYDDDHDVDIETIAEQDSDDMFSDDDMFSEGYDDVSNFSDDDYDEADSYDEDDDNIDTAARIRIYVPVRPPLTPRYANRIRQLTAGGGFQREGEYQL